jgi:transposase-like protein
VQGPRIGIHVATLVATRPWCSGSTGPFQGSGAGSSPAGRFFRPSGSLPLPRMKTLERGEARRLRREQGLPIKEIARRLDVAVSSVSVWVRDIELTVAQHEALLNRNPAYNHQRNGSRTMAARYRAERVIYQQEGRRLARLREPLHVAGCMLY